MLTMTMQLAKRNLALKFGEAKKLLLQSERTGPGDQASVDSDGDVLGLITKAPSTYQREFTETA